MSSVPISASVNFNQLLSCVCHVCMYLCVQISPLQYDTCYNFTLLIENESGFSLSAYSTEQTCTHCKTYSHLLSYLLLKNHPPLPPPPPPPLICRCSVTLNRCGEHWGVKRSHWIGSGDYGGLGCHGNQNTCCQNRKPLLVSE